VPAPYTEPSINFIANLAVYGSNATPAQKSSAALANIIVEATVAPVTLTGSFVVLTTTGPVSVGNGQKVITEGQVTATNMTPGLSGQLHIELEMDGSPVSGDIIQSCDTNGTGVTVNWKLAFVPGVAGAHVFSLSAKGTGDNTLAVASGAAILFVTLT
jgi:hypothetical protein